MNQFFFYSIFRMLILGMSILTFSAQAADELSAKKDNWLLLRNELEDHLKNGKYDLDSIKRKNELLKLEFDARRVYLIIAAKEFLEGRYAISGLMSEDQKVKNQFSVVLLAESLSKLTNSKIPEIKNFIQLYERSYPLDSLPIFKLTGAEINLHSPTEEKGGFHRGNNSIFMNVTKTGSSEWLFILLHELFHALDEKLYSATAILSELETFKNIMRMTSEKTNFVELTSAEDELLTRWVLAGLDRGLHAEYRAWEFGFSVYEKGFSEGLWGKIPFVEQVLSFKDKNESMKSFVYRYLSERAMTPKEEVLKNGIWFKVV